MYTQFAGAAGNDMGVQKWRDRAARWREMAQEGDDPVLRSSLLELAAEADAIVAEIEQTSSEATAAPQDDGTPPQRCRRIESAGANVAEGGVTPAPARLPVGETTADASAGIHAIQPDASLLR